MKEIKLLRLSDGQIQDYKRLRIQDAKIFVKMSSIIMIIGSIYFGMMSLGSEVLGMRLMYLIICVLSAVEFTLIRDLDNYKFTKEDADKNILISNDWTLRGDKTLKVGDRVMRLSDEDYIKLKGIDKYSIIGIKA